MPTSLHRQPVGVNTEKLNSHLRKFAKNGRYVDQYRYPMSKIGLFRFELVSIALIPLATALVLVGFECIRRLQRHRHQVTLESDADAGFASSLRPVPAAVRPTRLVR
jgi:hypothetical protein